jgi:hypothetical protein
MSCYGEEIGYVKFPVKDWTWFKKNLYNTYNDRLDYMHQIALKIHSKVSEEKKGKRNYDLRKNISEYLNKYLGEDKRWTSSYFWRDLVENSLIKDNKLKKPLKKHFKHKSASKSERLYDSDLYLTIDSKTKTIEYETNDNNHSIDVAESSYLGKLVFRLLNNINWTDKTGGYFKTKTEYDDWNGPSISRTYGKYKKPKYYKQI